MIEKFFKKIFTHRFIILLRHLNMTHSETLCKIKYELLFLHEIRRKKFKIFLQATIKGAEINSEHSKSFKKYIMIHK